MYQTRFHAEIKDNLIETVIFFVVCFFFARSSYPSLSQSSEKKWRYNGAIHYFFLSRAPDFSNNFCYNITKVKRTLLLRSTAKASSRSKNYASLSKGVFL